MKYTQSQLARLATSGGLRTIPRRNMAYPRQYESRWIIPVALILVSLAALIVIGLWGIQ